MAATQRFRSALHGFNREDVVHYIEYLNNQHANQVEQLNNQLNAALSRADTDTAVLRDQLNTALAKCARLEAQLAEKPEAPAAEPAPVPVPEAAPAVTDELEAYRRAERAERLAQERAQQIYDQANAVLAEASQKAEAAAVHIGQIADQASAQLQECQNSVSEAKSSFQDAVAALYAIRPQETEE